jgi:hypothetical protein
LVQKVPADRRWSVARAMAKPAPLPDAERNPVIRPLVVLHDRVTVVGQASGEAFGLLMGLASPGYR